MKPRFPLLACVALLLASASVVAAEKGYLGVGISVDGDGFFLNPTLKTVTVSKVAPTSPAAKAGLESGDQILEIDGFKVVGAKASDLKPYMEREVGQTLRMLIKKTTGEVNQVSVVLAQRPK